MVVLKKIKLNYRVKASTLMETLVATVLIVVVFMLASMIMNNLFSNSIKNNTRAIEAQLNELQYLQHHKQLVLPYQDTFQDWEISIEKIQEQEYFTFQFEAVNSKTNKSIRFETQD